MDIPFTTIIPSSKSRKEFGEGVLLDTVALLTTTSAAVSMGCSNPKGQRTMENMDLNAYIDSMSDEELEMTLEILDLLPRSVNEDIKYK